jgi:hypothetical protein
MKFTAEKKKDAPRNTRNDAKGEDRMGSPTTLLVANPFFLFADSRYSRAPVVLSSFALFACFAGKKNPHNLRFRSRSAFAMTETELNVIAALAIIGERRIPRTGNKTPAAIGTPTTL